MVEQLDRRAWMRGALGAGFALTLGGCVGTRQAPGALRIAARPDVLEAGPILHAASIWGPSRATVLGGGVPNLIDGPVPGALDRFEGLADLAGQSETQLLRLSVANPELRIVMTVTEGLYRIVARRSEGISGPADLKGKRIGTFVRTSAAFFVQRMLESVGLREADATIVALRPGEMAAALRDRRVDAIAIWEPESERAFQMIGADAVSFGDPAIYRELYNLNTTAAVLEHPGKRRQLVAFMRQLVESCRISAERPEIVWPLVVQSSGFDPAIVAASWPHHRFPANLPADMLDLLVVEESWIATQEGRPARSRAAIDRLIDRTVMEEVARR